MAPLTIDLYCGLGGWAEGFLAEGFDVVGFDIERRPYPGQLVLQDVLTLDGSQFRDATIIVASPPCQAYSYMAMPWKRSKRLAEEIRGSQQAIDMLNTLFDACFRIQREASEAAGRHIPMVVENVCGAQKWVGEAQARYGSYYLWGDIARVGKKLVALVPGRPLTDGLLGLHTTTAPQKFNPDGTSHGQGSWFAVADSNDRGSRKFPAHCGPRLWKDRDVPRLNDGESLLKQHAFHQKLGGTKNNGGSWFAVAHNKDSGHSRNPVNGVKGFARRFEDTPMARVSSRSAARKHASALIAKIPFPLARHIARVYKPEQVV